MEPKVITQEEIDAKNKRIKAEINRLRKLLKSLPKDTLAAAASLIRNVAFMSVTLDDLQETINRDGATSFYKNGENQFGTKKSPEIETYNSMIKNYMASMQQLIGLLPKEAVEDAKDELALFVKKAGRGR